MSQPPSFEPRRRKRRRPNSPAGGEVPARRRPEQPTRRVERPSTPAADSPVAQAPTNRTSGPRRQSAFGEPSARQQPAMDATRVDYSAQPGAESEPPSYQPRHSERSGSSVGAPPPQGGERRAAAGARPFPQAERTDRPTPQRPAPAPARTRKRMGFGKKLLIALLVFLLLIVGWGIYLVVYGNSQLHHVDALSGREDTPGTTYLIVGSDERTTGSGVEGKRSDTIMLLHVPEQGNTALISIPRDSYVTIPGHGDGKINSAFSIGGPELTVETVENLSGLTVDHYVQIGMDGVEELTDAVGGINLCYDQSFSDSYAKLDWEAGCHDVDGETALKFSRMRYSDPLGDIGRTQRQRQVVSKIIDKAISPEILINPINQRDLVTSGASVLAVSEGDSIFDIAQAGLALRNVMGPDGVTGTPPIASLNYRLGNQSVVLLDTNTIDQFWVDLANGDLTADSFATR